MNEDQQRLYDKFTQIDGRFFNAYHAQVMRNRKYYHLEFGGDLLRDESIDVLIPPTATRAIDEPADHILFHPKIKVPVRPTNDDEQREQDIAERKRNFVNSWWSQVSLRYNPIGDGRKPFLNEGKIAVRKTLRWELLPDVPQSEDFTSSEVFKKAKDEYRRKIARLGREEWLWDVELLDNTTVFEDPTSHRDPKYVFLRYQILAEEARSRWPDKEGGWKEYGDFDEIEYTEYWSKPVVDSHGDSTPGRFIQWVEDEVVHDEDSPYPYIPIVIEDAGFGVNHRFAKPSEKFVGMTQHAFPIFEAEAVQMTSLQEVTKISAFPFLKGRNLPDDKTIEVGAGKIVNLEGGKNEPGAEDIEAIGWPEVPSSVMGMLEKTDRLANSTFKMNILGGIPQTGVETATEADQNVRNATSKLATPIAALERVIKRLTAQVFMDIEHVIEAPITVFGSARDDKGEVTLKPSDINGYYHVSASLSTSDEEAISQNDARFWMEAALRAPFLSYTTAMERGGISDEPQKEMLKRAAEDVFLSEAFANIRIATGAQAFGELQKLVEQIEKGNAPDLANAAGPGVNSANTTGQAPVGNAPSTPGDQLIQNALQDRDVNLGASQLRA